MSWVEVRLCLKPVGQPVTVEPGRKALAEALTDMLLPSGLEYVHLLVEGQEYVISGVQRIESGQR